MNTGPVSRVLKHPPKEARSVRKQSSGDLSVEELFPDDMGYDADVEHVFPDKYEEADSEPEAPPNARRKWPTVDEDLAARMSRLSHDRSMPSSPRLGEGERGRKRQSKDISTDVTNLQEMGLPELEVMEMCEGQAEGRPIKRRRRRSRKSETKRSGLGSPRITSSSSSERTDVTGTAQDDLQAMDIT